MGAKGKRAGLFGQTTRILLALIACTVSTAIWASSAAAAVGVESFFFFGTANTQAGAHTDLTVLLALENPGEPEAVKDLEISAPAGFFAYPDAVPQCTAASFSKFECPPSTQVGLVTVRANHEGNPTSLLGTAPVYWLVPAPGEFASFGFVMPKLDIAVTAPVSVRTGPTSGLDFAIRDLPELAPLAGLNLSLWATPAEASHDSQRFPAGTPTQPAGCQGIEGTGCLSQGTPSNDLDEPLLRNPTACPSPLTSTLTVDSYESPGDFATFDSETLGATGCENLRFEAELTASLSTTKARTSTGLNLDISTPTEGDRDPARRSDSDMQAIAMTLPPALFVDRDSIEATSTCGAAEFDPTNDSPAECPAGSTIGSFKVGIPGLEDPLEGSAYFGGPESPDTYRLLLSADGSGMDVKLIALLEADEETGGTTLSLSDLPQIPTGEIGLTISPGAGFFITPSYCGSYHLDGEFTPWSAPLQPLLAATAMDIDSGPGGGPCPGPAEHVTVSLSPSSIAADGNSVTTATATITDAHGYSAEEDEVAFSSSDPGERIGPVTDNGDGTYSAQIVSSATPGTATITAVDESVEPEALGTAQLTQTSASADSPSATPRPPNPPSDAPPVVSLLKQPPHRTHDRTPTFGFASSEPNSTFACKVDDKRFKPCASTLTLHRLNFGPHVFEVRAKDAQGLSSQPTAYKFTVLRRSSRARRR